MGHGRAKDENDGEKAKVKTKADWIVCRAKLVFVCNACLWYFCIPIVEKRNGNGEVAEWLKAHAWKACLLERVTRVRIPVSPQKRSRTREEFRLRFFLKAVQYLEGKSKPCQD